MTNDGCGVYVHIPFCASKCYYCDFYSRVRGSADIDRYVRAAEAQIMRETFRKPVTSVYFGGGTPSLVSVDGISRIIEAVAERADVSDNAEITVEVNPESTDAGYIGGLRAAGVNRISMGIQSLDDSELVRLGRKADAARCVAAYSETVNAGIDNVSVDIMLAVPGQTSASLEKTVRGILELDPCHISAYLLKVEPDTVFGKRGVCEQSEDEQSEKYLRCDELLTDAGYEHYEISNFAKKGYRSRHNMLYWTGGEYTAIGCGASGYDGKNRYAIKSDIDEYILKNGDIPRYIEETCGDAEKLEESVIFGLRTIDGISDEILTERQRFLLEKYCKEGFAERTPDGYRLTARGFLVSDAITVDIISL